MNQNPFSLRKSSVSLQKPFYTINSSAKFGNLWEKDVYYGIRQYLYSGPKEEGYVQHFVQQNIRGIWSKPQIIDIVVYNASGRNFGIECKASKQTSVRLSLLFRHSGKDGQLAKESEFLSRANLIGAVAFVMREAGSDESSQRFCAYLISWNMLLMIRTWTITTADLDRYAKDKLIIKIPTTNGTFTLPQDVDIFGTLAKMDRKAGKIATDEKKREKLRTKPPNSLKPKKGR